MTATIWTYWDQGEHAAPALVRLCWESWRRLNPETPLLILDRRTLCKHSDLASRIDLSRTDIAVQQIADLVRLDLLSRHGGVWVDATVYCTAALKDWLPDFAQAGFFAFRNPDPDRLLSNWFLAADPTGRLIQEFAARYLSLFMNHTYCRQNTRSGDILRRILKPVLSRNVEASRYWVEEPWPGLLGTYPYFQQHYPFNSIILGDPAMADLWRSVPSFAASGPHYLARCAREADGTRQALDFLDRNDCAVHKLNWRTNIESHYWKTVLCALSRVPSERIGFLPGAD